MIITEELLSSLPENKYSAGKIICTEIIGYYSRQSEPQRWEDYSSYIDAYAALEAFIQSKELPYEMPSIEKNRHATMDSLYKFCNGLETTFDKKLSESELEVAKNKYKGIFEVGFIYRLTDGDLSRIQVLINELRNTIATSELFDANHRERLLNKLESLQKELHKKMSSLDKFWGLVGDAGIVLGKFGQDAKPFVDRITEIAQIIWRTQVNAEELPSGTNLPFLNRHDEQ